MKSEVPLISVIIPCYNQGRFLPETLKSVFLQTYQNWECIIVNDGSTDDTEQIALEWINKDLRFRVCNQKNKGLSGARNAGIDLANGTFILPLDADDKIGNTLLEKGLRVFKDDPQVKLVYCKAEKFGLKNEYWNLPPYHYERQLLGNHIPATALFRKRDFIKAGGYNENMVFGYEDWDFWLSLLDQNDKVVQIPEVLFYYRVKENSMHQGLLEPERLSKMQHQIYLNHSEIYFFTFGDTISLLNRKKYLEKRLIQIESNFLWRVVQKINFTIRRKK